MEKIIEIDILNKNDLIDKYNEDKLSRDLMEYIIKEVGYVRRKDKIKIVINNKCGVKNYKNIFINSLKEEYLKNLKITRITNIKQLFLLIIGIAFLFFSTLVKEESIWKEILLIGGWVPIWEVIDIELFSDLEGRRRRIILKKLIKSEFQEKAIEKE